MHETVISYNALLEPPNHMQPSVIEDDRIYDPLLSGSMPGRDSRCLVLFTPSVLLILPVKSDPAGGERDVGIWVTE